jgi:hypothetical protein
LWKRSNRPNKFAKIRSEFSSGVWMYGEADRDVQITKGTVTPRTAMKAQRGSRITVVLFNLNIRCGRCSKPRADRYVPGQETQYPFYRRLGVFQSQFGWVRKIWTPPGFDSRTVHLVASRIPNELSRSIPYR